MEEQICIAITDDFEFARVELPRILENFGVSTLFTAKDGQELLEKLSEGNTPQLVLLDIQMPVMNGYETAQSLRQNWPHIKVLAYSTDSHVYTREKIMKAGAHGFMPKGCAPHLLVEAMHSLLKTKQHEIKESQ